MKINPMHQKGENVKERSSRPNKRHHLKESLILIEGLEIGSMVGLTGPYPHAELDVLNTFPEAEIHCCELDKSTYQELVENIAQDNLDLENVHNRDFKEVLDDFPADLVFTDLCGNITATGNNHMDLVEASFRDSPKAVIVTGSTMGAAPKSRKILEERFGIKRSDFPDHRQYMNAVAIKLANTGDSDYKLIRSKRYRDQVTSNYGMTMDTYTFVRKDLI